MMKRTMILRTIAIGAALVLSLLIATYMIYTHSTRGMYDTILQGNVNYSTR